MVRRVRCPRCLAIIMADGDNVTCRACGLAGRVEDKAAAPVSKAATRAQAKTAKARARAAKAGSAAPRDPWTITIDLRKLAPSQWSPGAKAFSTLVMLAVVFAAGGVSGVVFERARTQVADDLDAGLFGASRNDAAGDGGATGAGLADAGKAPGTLIQGPEADDPADGTNLSGTPDTGNAPDNGSGGADDGFVLKFNGTGTTTIPLAYDIPAGVYKLTTTHYGSDGRLLRVEGQRGGAVVTSTSFSDFGRFVGIERFLGLPSAGAIDLRVVVQGDGGWELDVELMAATPSMTAGVSVSEKGDLGAGPFRLQGDVEVSFSVPAGLAHEVRTIASNGTKMDGCSFKGTATSQTATCSFAAPTTVYFDVAVPRAAGTWQLKAQTG